MAVKIKLAVRAINNRLVTAEIKGKKLNDLVAFLTNIEDMDDPAPETVYEVDIKLGSGIIARTVSISLPAILSTTDYFKSYTTPILLFKEKGVPYWFFKKKIYYTERECDIEEIEQAIQRIKLHDLRETNEIEALSRKVKNLESAIDTKRQGSRREPIPDDIQVLVMARDNEQCVKCGLKNELQFDHIIPVSKGGSNTAGNIQILCRLCNQRKGNEIGG